MKWSDLTQAQRDQAKNWFLLGAGDKALKTKFGISAASVRTHLKKSGVKKPKKESVGEESLSLAMKAAGIAFEREVMFHRERKWRFDFVVHPMIAVEVEGGTRGGGRHTRHAGFSADAVKYFEAQMAGYFLIRVTSEMVKTGDAMKMIQRALLRFSQEPAKAIAQ